MYGVGSPLMCQVVGPESPMKTSSTGLSLTSSYVLCAEAVTEPLPLAQRDQRENSIPVFTGKLLGIQVLR